MAGLECGKFDVSSLSPDDYVYDFQELPPPAEGEEEPLVTGALWLRAEVDEKIVIINNNPYVVIKFPNKVEAGFCENVRELNFRLANQDAIRNAQQGDPNNGPQDNHQANSLKLTFQQISRLAQQQRGVGASDANMLGFAKAAVMPVAAVIPMKSNIFTYGPWITSNFYGSNGGTSIQTNPELCPWVFGSYQDMITAGNAIISNMALGLLRAETGSVTLPGLPISSLTSLGSRIAGTGPNLSNISFSMGSNGISTTYQFATYTPKFGSLSNAQLDVMKTVAKNRQAQLKFLRSQAISQNKVSRQLARNANKASRLATNTGLNVPARQRNTVQRMLVGNMYKFGVGSSESDPIPTRTTVVMTDLGKSSPEMYYDYNQKAYLSLDGIFSPVSYSGANGNLPRLASFPKSGEAHVWYGATVAYRASGAPQYAQPPFSKTKSTGNGSTQIFRELREYNLTIDSRFEKALTNKASMEFHYHDVANSGAGHAIEFVGRETSITGSLPEGLSTNLYEADDENKYSDDYRFLSLKGPLMLHSWGFDTNGKPIPNKADIEASTESGIFTSTGLKDKFLDNWLQSPKTWPVAPIDLRFDRSRGVWVSPPPYKIIAAKLIQSLNAYGSGEAIIINSKGEIKYDAPLYDQDGNLVVSDENTEGAYIKVVDRIGQTWPSGENCYASYDPFNSEYIILSSSTQCSIITGRASGDHTGSYIDSEKADVGQFYYPPVAFGPDDFGNSGNGIRLYPVFSGTDGPKYITDKPVSFESIKGQMGLDGAIGSIRNPLGFAASSGDYVTIQRASYLDSIAGTTTSSDSTSDTPAYKPAWIIISVGRGPYLTTNCGEIPPANVFMPPGSYP